MLEEHNKKDKAHLINLIGMRSNSTPGFALLIGAGASASSDVKTASQMIKEWRQQLYKQSKSNEPFEEWLEKQDWYEDDDEYPILFEEFCDQRSQRRTHIEKYVKDAKPSWGYIYLSNIIANDYFKVIFTPNFDDLLNEACFLYTNLKPIVCAHDSAVVDIRVTSARPKIIKLHGDFLYDSIKNTIRETETLEKNMRDKFMQFSREYGLVIVGYGGNDRSIMDILNTMLRSEEGYFPNGVYWCIRKEDKDKVSKKLERLMRRENIYWVEIEDFDGFMAELHEGIGLTLPDAVRNPYKATTERLNRFILPKKEEMHSIIKKDIAELEKQVKRFKEIISGKAPTGEFDSLAPYSFLGDIEFRESDYKNALLYYEKALVQNPNDLAIMKRRGLSYIWTEDFEKALEISEKMIRQAPNQFIGYQMEGRSLINLNRPKEAIASYSKALKYIAERTKARADILVSRSNALLIVGKWKEALSDAEKALQINPKSHAGLINKCISLKKLGKEEETRKILQDSLRIWLTEYKLYRAAAFAVLGDKKNMLKELEVAIKEDSGDRVEAKFEPAFAEYKEDPDFRKLVYAEKERERKV